MLFVFSEVVERVRNPVEGRIFRPPTEHLGVADYVLRCMRSCWDEDPEQRPDIRYVRVKLKEMQAGLYVSCHAAVFGLEAEGGVTKFQSGISAASRWTDHSSCDFSMAALVHCTERPLILYMSLASAHGIVVSALKGTINLKHLCLGSGLNLNHSFFEGLTMMYELQRLCSNE